MINARTKFFVSILAFALCAILSVSIFGSFGLYAKADTGTVFCDDGTFNGTGEKVFAGFNIYYDDYKVVDEAVLHSAPSYGNSDPSMSNTCGPLSGMNIVAYYDRWYPNLVPNYETGLQFSAGYSYRTDYHYEQTETVKKSIYNLMQTGVLGGTTSASFKSGLTTYVKNAGYSLSSVSFYSNTQTVNLTKLKEAINQEKVAIIMCKYFNYASNLIIQEGSSYTYFPQYNYDAAHIMMIYGYQTYEYYNNGVAFRTETYLFVSSSFSSGEQGFVRLNDYLNIEEALIMTIS